MGQQITDKSWNNENPDLFYYIHPSISIWLWPSLIRYICVIWKVAVSAKEGDPGSIFWGYDPHQLNHKNSSCFSHSSLQKNCFVNRIHTAFLKPLDELWVEKEDFCIWTKPQTRLCTPMRNSDWRYIAQNMTLTCCQDHILTENIWFDMVWSIIS